MPVPEELSGDWAADQALGRLVVLCEWLRTHMDRAIEVTDQGDVRRVAIWQSVSFVVRNPERRVDREFRCGDVWAPASADFEVGHPLDQGDFLLPLMRLLGIWVGPEHSPWFDSDFANALNDWVGRTAYHLLRQEKGFGVLRKQVAQALAIPEPVLVIARAGRPRPLGPSLRSDILNLVWGRIDRFRRVAAENPRLLRVLVARALDGENPAENRDPVAALKCELRAMGFSEAAWRYLAGRGGRLFAVPWALSGDQSAWAVAVSYLRFLNAAGLPPPPPPSVAAAFLRTRCHPAGRAWVIPEDLAGRLAAWVLRPACVEADRRRGDPGLAGFIDEWLGVLQWAERTGPSLDRNQRRAGWPWLVRQWKAAETLEFALARVTNRPCPTSRPCLALGRFVVVPLSSTAAVVEESLAMRNSLRSYVAECAVGCMEFYSVRDRKSGKRLACMGFRVDSTVGEMLFADVRGYANTRPASEVMAVVDAFCGSTRLRPAVL